MDLNRGWVPHFPPFCHFKYNGGAKLKMRAGGVLKACKTAVAQSVELPNVGRCLLTVKSSLSLKTLYT